MIKIIEKIELKPCPHCGGELIGNDGTFPSNASVTCKDCDKFIVLPREEHGKEKET